MSLPSVSVVIPLYNHQKYVAAALYSVVNQTYPPKEIIVIDDGSSDSSAALVAAVADVRQEVVFWSRPNRGAHKTINEGIHRASGDFVAILNSDDMYEPTRLERAVKAFDARPEADVVATRLSFINSEGAEVSFPWFENALAFYHQCDDLGLALVNGNFFMTTSNIVARRTLFEEIGYFSDFRYAHDLDFFLRMVLNHRIIEFIDEKLINYRVHGGNTIKESPSKVKVEWAAAVANYLMSHVSQGSSPTRWIAATPYFEVLRRHKLTELVLMCMLYHYGNGTRTPERSDWRHDERFMDALQATDQ